MKNRGLTAAMNAAAFAAERGGAVLVVVACGAVCSLPWLGASSAYPASIVTSQEPGTCPRS